MPSSSNPLAGVKAVLFDVFGTVVDWEGSVSRLLIKRAKEEDLALGDLDLLEFTKTWRAGYMRRTKAIAAGAPGPTNIDILHRELLDELLVDSNYAVLAKWDEKARAEVCQFWHQLDGWADSAKGLKELHEIGGEGVLVGTLSNGSARLLIDLARHADLRWDVIFSGDILKAYKPNAAMYLGACTTLDLKPEQVAMVAAHIYDLRAAASFGMKTIYVPRHTEDQAIEGFAGPDSVRGKAEGGEVDVVCKGIDLIPAALAI